MMVAQPYSTLCVFVDTITSVQLTKGPFCLLSIYYRYMQVHKPNAYNEISSQNKAEKEAENLWVQKEEMPPVHPICSFSTICYSCCNPFVYLSFFSFHCSTLLALLLLQFSVFLGASSSLCSCQSRSSFVLEISCTTSKLSLKIRN